MADNQFIPSHFAESLKSLSSQSKLPPVQQWNPPFCGDIGMRIQRDGSWLYMGSPITRPAMVRLFSTVLRHDDDGYYLVTPVEKVRIQVDDVPFVIVSMEREESSIHFTTNVGDEVILGKGHELRLIETKPYGLSPYVCVRDRLDALIHRNVYYQLVDIAEERLLDGKMQVGIASAGEFYSLEN